MIKTNKFFMKGFEIMIDPKFALRFSFPHTQVHIVDNSGYNGEVRLIEADDPSLFATLVCCGTNFGEDGKVIKLTRSDIAGVAYGLNNVTSADRERYGQAIDYPMSLLEQNVPVQFLRVTPEESTYAFATILIDYRWDDSDVTDPKLHVRFRKESLTPAGAILSNFKTRDRLAQAIMNDSSKKHDPTAENPWYTRVFAVIVSGGRGSAYNAINFCIDLSQQVRHPSNVRYTFTTQDTNRGVTVESFSGSLVNFDNANRFDYIETANNLVNQRAIGSSFVVPFINESVVHEVFNFYKDRYTEQIELGIWYNVPYIINTYKTLNVNTFDILYGRYIYDGGTDERLPFYQVDVIDNELPQLDPMYRIAIEDKGDPSLVDDKIQDMMLDACYGVKNAGNSIYIGDVYLSAIGSSYMNPRLSVVTNINQYTGAVTAVTFSKIFTLNASGTITSTAASIKKVYTSIDDATKAITAGIIVTGDIFAVINKDGANEFKLYCCQSTATNGYVEYTVNASANTILKAIDYSELEGSGLGNVLGIYSNSATPNKYKGDACKRVGFSVVDKDTGFVYVNEYNINTGYADTNPISTHRIKVSYNACRFGSAPVKVSGITADNSLVGESYDMMAYPESAIDTWFVNDITVNTAGTGYAVGDIITVTAPDGATCDVTFEVIATSGDGLVNSIGNITGTISLHSDISACATTGGSGSGLTIDIAKADMSMAAVKADANPSSITRYNVTGVVGSIFKVQDSGLYIPDDYYSPYYGESIAAENGGYSLENGSTGFFDDKDMDPIVFKYKYAELLVKAFRGNIDKRILSPSRVPAKFLFDAGYNTIVGSVFTGNTDFSVPDAISGSTMYSDDEKDEILFHPEIIEGISYGDVDVKQAMYDLMIHRVYDGIDDETRRSVGPGSGLSLHLDSGITDAATALLINKSFSRRFTNPNASWDIGGYKTPAGIVYTYTKHIVDNLFRHMVTYSINKPYVGKYSAIQANEYVECYPDIAMEDVDERELFYKSGGNAWIPDTYGVLKRQSQRTFKQDDLTSDLIQESNMRTLSQLTYLLKNKIESVLMEYSDDGVLKALKDECNNMFSSWVGDLVEALNIDFARDINIDGREIVICSCDVTFRGLIISVPIIVNVNRRQS